MSVIPAITQSVGMARVSLGSYPFPVYLGEHSKLFRNSSIFLGVGLFLYRFLSWPLFLKIDILAANE